MDGQPSRAPLSGITVVDCTSFVLGPTTTLFLAHLGARVIKVEAPTGDPLRQTTPTPIAGMSTLFVALNHGKESIAVDLKHAAGQDIVRRLVASAEVFVHNVSPRAVRHLGIGYERLQEVNTSLVYCALTSFGSNGPYREAPAYDDTVQARSGLAYFQGAAEGRPEYMRTAIVDRTTGIVGAYAILGALFQRERTGAGTKVEVPMFESLVQLNLTEQLAMNTFVPPAGPESYWRLLAPERRPFRVADGYLSITPITDAHWRSMLTTVGRADLLHDARFATMQGRNLHLPELLDEVARSLTERTVAEWSAVLEPLGIPVSPVLTPPDLLGDEHLTAVGMFDIKRHDTGHAIRQVRSAVLLDDEPTPGLPLAPTIGADTRSIAVELGLDPAEIDALVASGVIATGTGLGERRP